MHFQPCKDRIPGMLRIVDWCTPEGHDGIADILVERAAMLAHDQGHGAEILVHQARQFVRFQSFRDSGESANVRKQHGQLGLASGHAVVLGIPAHLLDQFRRHVLAEQPCQLTLGSRLNEVAPGHVHRIQERNRDHAIGQGQHEIEDMPIDEIHAEQQQQHDSADHRRPQRRQHRQQESHHRAGNQHQQYIGAEHVGWLVLDDTIQHAGDQVGMYLDPRVGRPHRRGPQVHESRRCGADHDQTPGELFLGNPIVEHIGNRDIRKASLIAAIGDQRRRILVHWNAHYAAVSRLQIEPLHGRVRRR